MMITASKYQFLKWVIFTIAVFLTFTASGYSANPKLTAWIYKTYLPDFNNYIKDVMIDFGQKNDADMEVTFVDMRDMVTKLTPMIETGNAPDIRH